MGELVESNHIGEGRAHRFHQDLLEARDFFRSREAWTPLATFSFRGGRTSAVKSLSDVVPGLFGALQSTVELPNAESIPVSSVVYGGEARPSEFELSFEGVDGPLNLRFADGSVLTATVERSESLLYRDRWTAGTDIGFVQQHLEEIASLAQRCDLTQSVGQDDRPIAEAVLTLLGRLAATKDPPRGVVQAALHWLVPKVDTISGAVAGTVVAATPGHVMSTHVSSLARSIRGLSDVANA